MTKSFKEIIEELESFVAEHYKSYEFGWGNTDDISTKNHKFPLIWAMPTTSSIVGKMIALRFEIYVMDVLRHDKTNELSVMNGTLLIGNDLVINYFNDYETNSFILDEENVTITPFSGDFDDHCGGWIFEVEIQIENTLDHCSLPLASVVPIPVPATASTTTNLVLYTEYGGVVFPLTTYSLYNSDKITLIETGITNAGGIANISQELELGTYWVICEKIGMDIY